MAKTLYLKNIPKDIQDMLVDKQAELKKKKGHNKFSLECTIYATLRECKKKNQ